MAKDFDSYELRVVKGVPYYGGVISGHFYPIGLGVWVDHVIETFDTSEFTMKISYRISESNEEIRSCIFSSKEMSLKGYVHYNSLGVDVTYRTQQLFEAYINSERRKATEYIYNHKFLGWCRHNNLLIYRHQTATIGKKTSTYTGDFEIAPKGTYRAWIDGVKKHILGHYPLEAALVIGLSISTQTDIWSMKSGLILMEICFMFSLTVHVPEDGNGFMEKPIISTKKPEENFQNAPWQKMLW